MENNDLSKRLIAFIAVLLVLMAGVIGVFIAEETAMQNRHIVMVNTLSAEKLMMAQTLDENTMAMNAYETKIAEYDDRLQTSAAVNQSAMSHIEELQTDLAITYGELQGYKSRENNEENQAAIKAHHTLTEEHLRTSHVEDFGYYLYQPNGLYNTDLPLILNLHGAGEGGGDLDRLLNDYSVTQFIYHEQVLPNAIVIIPHSPLSYWGPYTSDLMEIIESVCSQYHVDESRISIAGFSNGAVGAFAMVKAYPEFFSAMVIEGMTITRDLLETAKHIPTRLFLGEKENNYERSQELLDEMMPTFLAPKNLLTVIPEYGHNTQFIWKSEKYDLFNWLISHTRYEQGKED